MATSGLQHALDWARSTILEREAAALTDAQLLEAFLVARSEAAIRAIIRRHGPMVFGVCKRFLPEHHDAEDAFQAVFLVFIRRADSIRPRSQLANWLYGVALKTARKTRAYLGKKRFREQSMGEVPDHCVTQSHEWSDFWSLLDRELERLPAIYRTPIVLCDLEGKSRREAARLLCILDGTLSGRLARGRRQLAARLSRRGVTLSGAALAAALVSEGASAALPTGLVATTSSLAFAVTLGLASSTGVAVGIASISQGVIRSMLIAKSWQASTVLVVSLLAIGTGVGGLSLRNSSASVSTQSVGSGSSSQSSVKSDQTKPGASTTQPGKNDSQQEAEREMVKAIRKAKEIEWLARWKGYQAGHGALEPLLQAAAEFNKSELELAETVEDRARARRAHLDRALAVNEIVKARYEAGKIVLQDLALVTDMYESGRAMLTAEISRALDEKRKHDAPPQAEKRKNDAPQSNPGQGPDISACADLLQTGNEEWEARWKQYSAGRGTLDFLLVSSRHVLTAQLKCAKNSSEKVKAYLANIDRLASVEAINQERFDAGKVALQDLLQARYARIEAELEFEEWKRK